MASLTINESPPLYFDSLASLKRFLSAPERTPENGQPRFYPPISIPYKEGLLLSKAENTPSKTARKRLFSGIVIKSETTESLRNIVNTRFIIAGKIQPDQRGYCSGAVRLFINELLIEKRKTSAVNIYNIAAKVRQLSVKAMLLQIFNGLMLDEEINPYPMNVRIKKKNLQSKQLNANSILDEEQIISRLPPGIYDILLTTDKPIGHAIALIKGEDSCCIFDNNEGLILFYGPEYIKKFRNYLIDTCVFTIGSKNWDTFEYEFNFSLHRPSKEVNEIKNRLVRKRILVIEENEQITSNISLESMVQLTLSKKVKMYFLKYSHELPILFIAVLFIEGIKVIPIPYVAKFCGSALVVSSSSKGSRLQIISDQYRRVWGPYFTKTAIYLPGIVISVTSLMLFSPTSFLAKIGVTAATLLTASITQIAIQEIKPLSKVIKYAEKKIEFASSSSYSFISNTISKASQVIKRAVRNTANFFRKWCYVR